MKHPTPFRSQPRILVTIAALGLSASACSGGTTELYTGSPAPAGAALDAAPAVTDVDDAALFAADAGGGTLNVQDTGANADGGDGSIDADATGSDGAPSDAAGDGGTATLNGCLLSGDAGRVFVDRTDGDRTLRFPENGMPAQYNVPCMTIRVGQKVTWKGSFQRYPLEPSGGLTPSPIELTDDGDEESFRFRRVGVYGFRAITQPALMLGAINVLP